MKTFQSALALVVLVIIVIAIPLTVLELQKQQTLNQHASTPSSQAPYPPSAFVTSLTWDPGIVTLGGTYAGDNWPITWGDDDLLYTSYNDGNGFVGNKPYAFSFAAILGDPINGLQSQTIHSNIDAPQGLGGKNSVKTSGMIMVNNTLYVFARNIIVNNNYQHARMAFSTDHGKTWKWKSWTFSHMFGSPEFVQYGKNYEGGDPNYVYIVSSDSPDAYVSSPHIVMARAPLNSIDNIQTYEYFSGTSDAPQWSTNSNDRKPIFFDTNGTYRISLSYNLWLKRYFLTSSRGQGSSALGVFDAPNPWGPWTTVYYSANWSNGQSYHHKFPTKWMSSDGTTMWLLFSGLPGGGRNRTNCYCFALRKATLTVSSPIITPIPSATPSAPLVVVSLPTLLPTPTPFPTPTPTAIPVPTATPTPTPGITSTPTPVPTDTPTPIPTEIAVVISPTPVLPSESISPTPIQEQLSITPTNIPIPTPTPTQLVAGATKIVLGGFIFVFIFFATVLLIIPSSRRKILLLLVKASFYEKNPLQKMETKDTSSLSSIDKTYDVKLIKKKKGPSPTWVLLTDENGSIEGYFDGELFKEGFAQVKGILHTDNAVPYITISSIEPMQQSKEKTQTT